MLLGVHMFRAKGDPEEFASFLKTNNLKAGYLPYEWELRPGMSKELENVKKAFEKNNVILAEVGAWRNPFHPDSKMAKENTEYIIDRLAIADEINARCTICTIGNPSDDNSDPANISNAFYQRALELYRTVVDRVKPHHTKMCFELLPFNFLDSTEMYERFVKDIDRPEYIGIHLDPFNVITSPRAYYNNKNIIVESVRRLAVFGIRSLHLKDLKLHTDLPNTFLEEVPAGNGGCDIKAYLTAIDKYLPADTPVLIEHLNTEDQFIESASTVRRIASEAGINSL